MPYIYKMGQQKIIEEIEKRKQEILENKNGISWYLSYKEPTKEE